MQEIKNNLRQALRSFSSGDIQPFEQTSTRMYAMDYSHERKSDFPLDRFERAEENGVLYRPEIVVEMKRILSTGNQRQGLLVRGPHGVGKSHSLVNLVRSLRADGHIVTFVPTCETFISNADFLIALFRSIGSSMSAIGISRSDATSDRLEDIIDFIENALPTINKTWFFVFDQVNRIFARPQFIAAKDVGVLPLPFALMKLLNLRTRMKTVISASANNTVAYKENHPGFFAYDHAIAMSLDEIVLWRPELVHSRRELDTLAKVTGLCPLQVSKYLGSSRAEFEAESVNDVLIGVAQLLAEQNQNPLAKKSIVRAAVHCLLSLPFQPQLALIYDKKYSVLKSGHFMPLFPLVLVAYRDVFWDDLILYVEKNEGAILEVCANINVTNDVRGRLFELIVIVRLRKNSVLTRDPTRDVLPASVDSGLVFETQELPTAQTMANNTLFIPKNSNFPAIDLILKSDDGADVWAVQVHVADHEDVLPAFKMMCQSKGWFEAFDNIYLVYLGPSETVKNMLTCIPRPAQRRSKRPRLLPPNPIQVSATTIHDFECLRDIQWTALEPQ